MYPVPVLYKLAPGELGCESKMKFHQRNKKDVAVRTRSKAFTGAVMLSQVSGQVVEARRTDDRPLRPATQDFYNLCSVRSAFSRPALRGGSSAATPSNR